MLRFSRPERIRIAAAAAFWTGSLALLADAVHMLTDAGALALALFATWIAARPPTPAKTYGYYRAEILAALVNALVLLVVAGAILTEAWVSVSSSVSLALYPWSASRGQRLIAGVHAWSCHGSKKPRRTLSSASEGNSTCAVVRPSLRARVSAADR